jgi:hypothetical protein
MDSGAARIGQFKMTKVTKKTAFLGSENGRLDCRIRAKPQNGGFQSLRSLEPPD